VEKEAKGHREKEAHREAHRREGKARVKALLAKVARALQVKAERGHLAAKGHRAKGRVAARVRRGKERAKAAKGQRGKAKEAERAHRQAGLRSLAALRQHQRRPCLGSLR
jgi:hypothetical protein